MQTRSESVANSQPQAYGRAVRAAPMLTGFSAVLGQIVLMRELMTVFNGNEISLGILLATWLFWTAVGSIACSSSLPREGSAHRAVAVLECLLGISLPLTIWALHASKSIFQMVPGELVGPLPMLLASLVCLSFFCIVAGALFVAAVRAFNLEFGVDACTAVSAAYLLDAAGSAIGGIVASLLLLRFLDPFQIAGIVLVLNLLMACVLVLRMNRKQFGIALATSLLLALLIEVRLAPWMHSQAQARQWRGFQVLASHDSIYGNLRSRDRRHAQPL